MKVYVVIAIRNRQLRDRAYTVEGVCGSRAAAEEYIVKLQETYRQFIYDFEVGIHKPPYFGRKWVLAKFKNWELAQVWKFMIEEQEVVSPRKKINLRNLLGHAKDHQYDNDL